MYLLSEISGSHGGVKQTAFRYVSPRSLHEMNRYFARVTERRGQVVDTFIFGRFRFQISARRPAILTISWFSSVSSKFRDSIIN
jgi:hypothetical protein